MPRRVVFLFPLLFMLAACDAIWTVPTTAPITTTTTTVTTITTESTTIEALTSTTLAPLPPPTDIELDDEELLTWTGTSPYVTFVVEINGVEYTVSEPQFDMSNYPDAVYEIRIRTILAYRQSEYSDIVTFTIRNHPEVPWGLAVIDGVLSWNAVDDAIGYRVTGGTSETDVAETSISVIGLTENAVYTLSVRALFADDVVSDPSESYFYHTYFASVGIAGYRFNKNAPLEVVADLSAETWTFDGILSYDGTMLSEEFYTVEANLITFDDFYLIDLPYDEYEYLVFTSAGYYELSIEVVDDRAPYMISSNQVAFTGADVVLDFELYDGMIGSFSGNDIASQDYFINGSQVTISAAYIAFKFAENPARTALILGYNLSANDHVTIGYVFIRLPA